MSPKFLDPTKRITVRVPEDKNWIQIRAKMSWTDRRQVEQEMYQIEIAQQEAGNDDAASATFHYSNSGTELALLRVNVTSWGGPDLDGRPLTDLNFVDPDDPLVKRALEMINEQNESRTEPVPEPEPDPEPDPKSPPAENT